MLARILRNVQRLGRGPCGVAAIAGRAASPGSCSVLDKEQQVIEKTAQIVSNHMISATDGVPPEARARALVVRRLQMLPVECVVRGYVTGSGWKDYQASGTVSGIPLPGGRH